MKTDRIKTLLKNSLTAINQISAERAILITEFYKQAEETGIKSPALLRSKAFSYILKNKKICISDNELIVGERGPEPKATPTYPEICLHSIIDLETLDQREKVGFKVNNNIKKIYREEIIPFWEGKSQREIIFSQLSAEWKSAYSAGIFTEFQEQRAPGHTVAGNQVFKMGLLDYIDKINQTKKNATLNSEQFDELEGMKISAQAMIDYAKRHSEQLEKMRISEKSEIRKKELTKMAEICRKVPAHAPETFHEALQHYWFLHIGVITEVNPWDSFNPGRLDQHLLPFYINDIKNGILTKEEAIELLQAFWIKFNNHPAPPKVGITAQESNTYTDFALINLGGLSENGENAVNDLSYIILDVIEEMRILQPSSMVQISHKNPDKFIERALEISKTGFGQPSFFNTDAIIEELLNQGKSITDARNGGASGCVETGAFGTESYILTGYFNLNKILELTLNNGYDPVQKKQVGIKSGDPNQFKSIKNVINAFNKQLKHFIDIKIEGNLLIEELYAKRIPVPFLSLLIEDCISNAIDYNSGGARYNTSYIQGVGLGSITDNLAAINEMVFKTNKISLKNLNIALRKNFIGYEDLRSQLIYECPKYGNDNEDADQFATKVFDLFYRAVNKRTTYKKGHFRINMLPTTSHVYFGSKIGAMPDGRKSGEALSEGISPVQGCDTQGPTAVIKSASKINHLKTGGTLLNQKFTPSFFNSKAAIPKLRMLIRSYFSLKGHHIQFNVIDAKTLRKAQDSPEKYRDLIVRVAGYSDYFNDLGIELQNEIIKRTEHNA